MDGEGMCFENLLRRALSLFFFSLLSLSLSFPSHLFFLFLVVVVPLPSNLRWEAESELFMSLIFLLNCCVDANRRRYYLRECFTCRRCRRISLVRFSFFWGGVLRHRRRAILSSVVLEESSEIRKPIRRAVQLVKKKNGACDW